jgi:hypothetical protein
MVAEHDGRSSPTSAARCRAWPYHRRARMTVVGVGPTPSAPAASATMAVRDEHIRREPVGDDPAVAGCVT